MFLLFLLGILVYALLIQSSCKFYTSLNLMVLSTQWGTVHIYWPSLWKGLTHHHSDPLSRIFSGGDYFIRLRGTDLCNCHTLWSKRQSSKWPGLSAAFGYFKDHLRIQANNYPSKWNFFPFHHSEKLLSNTIFLFPFPLFVWSISWQVQRAINQSTSKPAHIKRKRNQSPNGLF